ncbi:MAG: hypothetical protein N4A63_18100 [Vallitalea sp.]|jgi:hypothetical protein|nr:hypothetical protein [Vallitalea sp.]
MKSKHLKGEHGYIYSQKRRYLLASIIGLLIIIPMYLIDRFVLLEGNVLLLITVLLVLPLTQFIVKFIVYLPFKECNKEVYTKFEKLSDSLVCLSSLVMVRGKKTLFYQLAIVSGKEITLLIDEKKSRKEMMEYKELVEKLIRPKGYSTKVRIFNSEKEMYSYINNDLSILLNNVNPSDQVELANILLDNAI